MPEWSAEVWGMVISAMIGATGVIVAVIALRRSSTANRHADAANRIAKEANAHSREANAIARQALQVQERGVNVAISSEQKGRSADIRVHDSVKRYENGQRATVGIENRGPSDADDVTVTLHHGDRRQSMSNPLHIPPGYTKAFPGSLSGFPTNPGTVMELRITYVDTIGEHSIRKRVTIGPGERFVDRDWTISNWSDEG